MAPRKPFACEILASVQQCWYPHLPSCQFRTGKVSQCLQKKVLLVNFTTHLVHPKKLREVELTYKEQEWENKLAIFLPNFQLKSIHNLGLYTTHILLSVQVSNYSPVLWRLVKRKIYPWHTFYFPVLKQNHVVILATMCRLKEQLKAVTILLASWIIITSKYLFFG